MILKASQRGGGKQLGQHLLKADENEHVEVHEVSGFVSDNIPGAMKEIQAVAMGTRCKQPYFSASLNPPQDKDVPVQTFETAVDKIEQRLGLTGQPRIIVFHEKEGRRHAHCVWSRIDAGEMKAIQMSYIKNRMTEVSREMYLENGWEMPEGLRDRKYRDPRNFTLAEWQQAKRMGRNAGDMKAAMQDAWNMSDGRQAFIKALEERGMFLAKGDRRGHVAVTYEGEVVSIAKFTGRKSKDVRERLGQPDGLRSVDETRQQIGNFMDAHVHRYLREARFKEFKSMQPLNEKRSVLKKAHGQERARLDEAQKDRWTVEEAERAARMKRGFRGLWDKLTGKAAATRKQNEMETFHALERDRRQRHDLVAAQMAERRELQQTIEKARRKSVKDRSKLYQDLAAYKRMRDRHCVQQEFNRAANHQKSTPGPVRDFGHEK